jgi:phosphoribosylamine--glycine ligase
LRVLVIGNGGRECALASSLLVSPKVTRLVITPPNYGVQDPFGRDRVLYGEVGAGDIDGLLALAQRENITLTVVGPEAPLAAGIVDTFRAKGLRVFGPSREAARLEAEKSFAKEFMRRHGLPTGRAQVFTGYEQAKAYLAEVGAPVVIKADGLAAGKGVIICRELGEAEKALHELMVEGKHSGAGRKALIEEYLEGPEISFFCLFDGETAFPFPTCSDYKRLLDGNEGPNTGGMGCMCPSPYATPEVMQEWNERILQPFVEGCRKDGLDYRGVVYFGVMVTADGLKLLEFNVRFGDPEAQAMLPLLQCDLLDVLAAAESRTLDRIKCSFSGEATVTVVMATANYPYGKSEPAPIEGLERIDRFNEPAHPYTNGSIYRQLPRVNVFFAGVSHSTEQVGGEEREVLLATGGRVLAVTARGGDLSEARRLAYEAVGNLHFTGAHFRTDIALLR